MTRIPHAQVWQRCLSERYPDRKAKEIIARAQSCYAEYCAQHAGEKDRANRSTLKRRVLPGLALYRALLDEQNDPGTALAEVDRLFRAAFFQGMAGGIRLLNLLPDPFSIVRPVLKRMTRNEYVPGAQEIVEDSPDCFAVNTYRCLILDTLAQHGARELAVCFCNTDDWLAGLLPAVRWERTMTLGRGDPCCDFRWRRRTKT